MGSLVPFQDLNYPPQQPKYPKSEPLDDVLYHHHQQQNQHTPNLPNTSYHQEQVPVHVVSEKDAELLGEFSRINDMFRAAFNKRNNGEVEVLEQDLAIVPCPQPSQPQQQPQQPQVETRPSTALVKRAMKHRSGEMVRVSDLGIEDQIYFRDLVRRTRMVYESLRIYLINEDVEFGQRRNRPDLVAGKMMSQQGLWLNRDKRIIGSIPGVYVGDVFYFRMELCVIGLHGQLQAGIDYVPISQSVNREPVATSIIVSGGYEDDEDAGDVIIYTGHGGQGRNSVRQVVHQKLEGGNLGLERSRYYGIEVRVIRGIKSDKGPAGKIYVYDGLYKITDCWFDIGKSGFGVYKYKMVRLPNQPEMGSSIFKFAADLRKNPLSVRPSGYLSLDISNGKERSRISVYNDIDSDQDPLHYEYVVKPIYPLMVPPPMDRAMGCNCVTGCSDNCYCAQINGGKLAYDQNGILLVGKSLIYECGTHCHCPPTCRNRVTQRGLKYQLEIFRSMETGWGVRPLDMIPAGAFICEYTGVVLTKQQASIFTMNGDSLVDPSRFPERWREWGDLSLVCPGVNRPDDISRPPLDFGMDVSRLRNVACYFSHSSTPNVMVQFVMHDRRNVLYPHLMLFAMENIPPLRDLSLDYGVTGEWSETLAICDYPASQGSQT